MSAAFVSVMLFFLREIWEREAVVDHVGSCLGISERVPVPTARSMRGSSGVQSEGSTREKGKRAPGPVGDMPAPTMSAGRAQPRPQELPTGAGCNVKEEITGGHRAGGWR